MKQKLLAVLATFVAVTPFVGVKAAEIKYTIGSEHNFIVNDTQKATHDDTSLSKEVRESVGVKVTALGEETEDNYVRALATGAISFIFGSVDEAAPTSYRDLANFKHMIDDINGKADLLPTEPLSAETLMDPKLSVKYELGTGEYIKDYTKDPKYLDVMSAQDFIKWFKGEDVTTLNPTDTYTLTGAEIEKFNSWFYYPLELIANFETVTGIIKDETMRSRYAGAKLKGFYTSTADVTAGTIWVVDVTAEAGKATAVTLRQIEMDSVPALGQGTPGQGYITVPILYFNKTYDCKYDSVEKTACYKCGDEYQWLVVGSQASTCEAVSSVTSKAKCVKPSKTGVEDYILEFAIAAGICGLVLVAVKRKSLFSRV